MRVEPALTVVVQMPVTPKLPVRLYEKLGEEAMTDLAGWFADMEAQRQEMDARHLAEIEKLRETDAKLQASVSSLETRMAAGFAELKAQVAGVQAELIKWTFVFWLGTVGIVVMLIRFLNNRPG